MGMQEFRAALRRFNFDVTDQELISIMRKFDPDGDGSIKYDEFCKSVLEDDYKSVQASNSGQVIHRTNAYLDSEKVRKEEEARRQEQEHKQSVLNEILVRARETLTDSDDINEKFMAADERGDQHCGYD